MTQPRIPLLQEPARSSNTSNGAMSMRAAGGVALLKFKDLDGSVKHLSMAVTLNPRLAMAHSNFGLAYEDLGDVSKAEKEYARHRLRQRPSSIEQ